MGSDSFLSPSLHLSVRDSLIRAALAVNAIYTSRDFTVTDKGDEGPLTTADLLSNAICQKSLLSLLPDAGWLSEETLDDISRMDRSLLWVVDPIDGTREFVAGIPQFSLSVGLVEKGEPILGAVALPAENRIIYGNIREGVQVAHYEGIGPVPPFRGEMGLSTEEEVERALLQEFRILREELPPPPSELLLERARILVSRSEFRKGKFDTLKEELSVEPSGSVARKLALLAAGEGDLVVSLYPKNDWDICGGDALVRSRPGYMMVDLEVAKPREYNQKSTLSYGLTAGPALLVEQFVELYRRKKIPLERSYG